jgi:hypothetical protein
MVYILTVFLLMYEFIVCVFMCICIVMSTDLIYMCLSLLVSMAFYAVCVYIHVCVWITVTTCGDRRCSRDLSLFDIFNAIFPVERQLYFTVSEYRQLQLIPWLIWRGTMRKCISHLSFLSVACPPPPPTHTGAAVKY